MNALELSRRQFAALPGFGLFVTLEAVHAQEPGQLPGRTNTAADFNAFLRIGADGRVQGFFGKVELGQGAMTSLAQVLAEDLDVALDSVDLVFGDTAQCPYDMGTFGSMTTPFLVPAVRRAAAEARSVLLGLAAERLQVPESELSVRDGVVRGGGKSVTYAALVEGKRIERHRSGVAVKPVEQFRVIGQSPHRKDAVDKVTGAALYAGDQRPAGLLHARILRPPAHGAKRLSVDTAAAAKRSGVRVVTVGEMVAVLHERPDLASAAMGLVKAEYAPTPTLPNEKSIYEHIRKTAPQAKPAARAGDVSEGERLAQVKATETWLHAYGAHAPIETHSATVVFEEGKYTVWASTQAPFQVQNHVARATGVAPAQVRVIARYVGGGFGGKTEADQAVEAALLARATGKPVQVVYDRGEEFFYDRYRPAASTQIRAGLTGEGRIAFWDAEIVGAGDREAKPFYDIPHLRVVCAGGWMGGNPAEMHPVAVGAWRAPSVNTNTFARECQMDVLAAQAGLDPLELRLKNLTDARMRRVLETAARDFGYKPAKGPSKRGIGLACGVYSNACNATIVQVVVKPTGEVRVERVVMAVDCGVVLNPDGLRQQAEGAIVMGLGLALSEEIRFEGGKVLTRNFDEFQLPRFSTLPKMEIRLIDNPQTQALGGGEPPIISMGAAVANVVFDATGVRFYELPLTVERVKAGLKGKV